MANEVNIINRFILGMKQWNSLEGKQERRIYCIEIVCQCIQMRIAQ